MLTKIQHHLSFPCFHPPQCSFMYWFLWKIWFIFKIRDTNIVPWHIERKGNHEDIYMTTYESWVHAEAERTCSWGQAEKGIIHYHLIFPQKYRKNHISFKNEGRWEILLFKLGIYPIEILNIQKLNYSKPTTTQKLESPQRDYYSRNNMFIGS